MCKLCSISSHIDMNLYTHMCMCVLSCFSRVQLFVTLWTVPAGSSVHRIFQVRVVEWVAMPSSRVSSYPNIEPTSLMSPALAVAFFLFLFSCFFFFFLPLVLHGKPHEDMLHNYSNRREFNIIQMNLETNGPRFRCQLCHF